MKLDGPDKRVLLCRPNISCCNLLLLAVNDLRDRDFLKNIARLNIFVGNLNINDQYIAIESLRSIQSRLIYFDGG